MAQVSYESAPVSVRDDLVQAHEQVWTKLAEPGTWWTGAERIAIAAETRNARQCQLCEERKATLSPLAVQGQHDSDNILPEVVIDVVHRMTTDPGRLSKEWYEKLEDSNLADTHYVEALGIVARTVSVDAFCRGIGAPLHPLPEPVAGEPTQYRPAAAKLEGAWVAMIPNGAAEPDGELYERQYYPGVCRALSLVPDEVRTSIHVLVPAQYMEGYKVPDLARDPGRAISRTQMELLASRVSALSECFY